MAEWRAGRRWRTAELEPRVAALAQLRPSVDADHPEKLTEDRGWRAELFESVLGREDPGAPVRDGLFARARAGLQDYRFSDPTIVAAHYRADAPLEGRSMLLEIKVLGLRYLSGVRVTDVIEREGDGETRWGFRYDTLEGHIERGCEWFELIKDHRSGRVRLQIRSRWRAGDLPNAWSRLGFAALSGFYRRLWLRRAHQRLSRLAQAAPPRLRQAGEMQVTAESPAGALATAAAVGALSGLRSFAAPTLIAARGVDAGPHPGAGRLEQGFARPGAALLAALAAAGEVLADKHPRLPSRLEPPALAGRIGAGALSGAVLAARWRTSRWRAAGAGGAAAAASSVASSHLRAGLQARLPRLIAAACEDALVLAAATALWSRLADRSASTAPGSRARSW
jgi:uncharacterized membrane protein/uncharacterized protein (UPF0548 family)